jgi:hypothetical protein
VHFQIRETLGDTSHVTRLMDLWRQNLEKGQRPFLGIDDRVKGYSDFQGEFCFRHLDQAYPGSKFVLTVRPLDGWLRSREEHVRRNLANPNYRGQWRVVDREAWTHRYHAHIADTRHHFAGRPQDLLIIDIPSGDGWNPLCRFLGMPVPDQPFPWGNRTNALAPSGPPDRAAVS